MNKLIIISVAVLLVIPKFIIANDNLNLYMIRDTSDGYTSHFKINKIFKGKILIDDRENQPEDRPRFSFWVDSSDMLKIPRNDDDHRWPWWELNNSDKIRKMIIKKYPNKNLTCATVEATFHMLEFIYVGITGTESNDGANGNILKIGKIETEKCNLDLIWYEKIIMNKDKSINK